MRAREGGRCPHSHVRAREREDERTYPFLCLEGGRCPDSHVRARERETMRGPIPPPKQREGDVQTVTFAMSPPAATPSPLIRSQ